MRGFRKKVKIAVLILVAAFVLLQAIRIEKSNPPVRSDISADPAIKSILRRACYNCHSNETVWPWYSNVAPASWLIETDVNDGRRHLNFSEWGTYSSDTQSHKLEDIADEMGTGEMPPWYYTLAHSDSRLSSDERSQIQAWTIEAVKHLPEGQ